MAKVLLRIAALYIVCLHAHGGELVPPPDLEIGYFENPQAAAEYSGTVLHYLNELSARRRLTMVFPNEQSPFYGVQMNHVNVGAGNLTFLARDLVRLDRIPIVFGRVYDSRKKDPSDFGPGWKLSLSESMRLANGRLLYTNSSNSEYELRVDNGRIYSEHAHLSGVRQGRLTTAEAILEAGELTRTFRRHGDEFRLVEIRDSSGNWVKLHYAERTIQRITSSSQRFIDIRRDERGRIVRASDDAGRTVQYAYDASDRLIESRDLAGEPYRYVYDAGGYLAELIDPRGAAALHAQFDVSGKVAELASQHDRATYEYSTGSTRVSNASQRAARFWHHSTGLTQAIEDFGGGVSALELDRELNISLFTFNGAVVARAEHRDGRLSSLTRANGLTERFAYDPRGRLIRVDDETTTARYAYDEDGHVVAAEDALGRRRYRYAPNGSLTGAEIGELRLAIQTNRHGLIRRVNWESAPDSARQHHATHRPSSSTQQPTQHLSLDILHNEVDRVRALRFNTPGGSFASDFRYNRRGFRELGRYDLYERAGMSGVASLSYDAVGNLTEWSYPGADGNVHVVSHTVGPQNQVLAVTAIGHEAYRQAAEYDAAGRLIRVAQGSRRDADFEYDELGRLTDVYLDGTHVLTTTHGPMDVDPVEEGDSHTPFTTIDGPVASSIFGSLETIAFTRPAGSPYSFVRFVPSMARFVLRDVAIAPPDAVTLASLKRTNFASRATLNPTPLLGFDKASSSLFIPPEYFSVNCFTCYEGATGFDLDRVGSGTIGTNETVNFVADASYSYCNSYYYDPETFQGASYPEQWMHIISVNGSYQTTYYGPLGYNNHEYLEFGLYFTTLGTRTIRDRLQCSCATIFLTQSEVEIEVFYKYPVWPTNSCGTTLQYNPPSHPGIDHVASSYGSAVNAMVGGTVTAYRSTGTPGGDENFVIVQGADGMYTIYAHVTPSVTSGTVVAGQTIGTVDNTGTTSNPHVHICRSSTQNCSGGVEYKPADCP